MRLELEIPTSLPSVANLREHWGDKAKRTKKLRRDVYLVCNTWRWFQLAAAAARAHGATITLTRVASRRYDRDNLGAAFKPIQDGIADALRMNDGSRELDWRYEQEIGKPDRVRVSIETPEAGAP